MSPESTSARPERRAVVALVALALAAFSFVTTEILPIGLLPLLARAMGRSESVVGLLVTGYAVIVLVASVPLARRTQRMPRRHVLVGTLAVFVVATLLSAMATSFVMLLLARLVTALAQSLFWSVVASTAAGLFPPAMRGRAIARFAMGSALAPVLGVPFAVWLGQATSWRVPFLVMAGAGTVACLAVLSTLPRDRARAAAASIGIAPDRGGYVTLLIVTGLAVTGVMGTFTYITPFLTEVSGFAPAALGPLLLVSGLAGIVGTWSIGTLLDRSPRHALVVPLVVAAVAMVGLIVFGATAWGAVAALAALGLGFNAFAPAVQSRTLHVAPGDVDIASAGSSAVFNAGIAAGSLVGGFVLSGAGAAAVPVLGLVATTIALAFAGRDLRRSAPRIATANARGQGRLPPAAGRAMVRSRRLRARKAEEPADQVSDRRHHEVDHHDDESAADHQRLCVARGLGERAATDQDDDGDDRICGDPCDDRRRNPSSDLERCPAPFHIGHISTVREPYPSVEDRFTIPPISDRYGVGR